MRNKADAELVVLTRSGNKDAFGELIARYRPMTLRLALGMVAHEDIAHYLSQEAFLAAYLSLDQLQEPTRFRGWLYSIMLNACRSYLREQKTTLSLEDILGGVLRNAWVMPYDMVDPHRGNRRDC